MRLLRHRDVTTTMGIYGHLLVDDLRGAVEALAFAVAATTPQEEPRRQLLAASATRARSPQK